MGATQLGIALKGGIKVLPTTVNQTLNNLPTTTTSNTTTVNKTHFSILIFVDIEFWKRTLEFWKKINHCQPLHTLYVY